MKLPSTIDNKRTFTKPNGEQIIDLTQQRYKPNTRGAIIEFFKVTEDFAMRPDLMAKLAYRDMTSTDLLMKQNGVVNPFSLDINDILTVQEKSKVAAAFSDGAAKERRDVIRNQYLDPSKAPSIDDNLKAFEGRKKPKKGKKKTGPALPPNFANFGDQEIKLRGGKIVFGEDVTANKEVCDEVPLSKSEFLKRLAKNRINNNNPNNNQNN